MPMTRRGPLGVPAASAWGDAYQKAKAANAGAGRCESTLPRYARIAREVSRRQTAHKTPKIVRDMLVDIVGRNGSLLLNSPPSGSEVPRWNY